MSPFQLGAALVVLAGALVALSAREIRLVLGGLVVSMGGAALVADPLPSPLAAAVRIVAAVLGAQLVLIALRGRVDQPSPPPLGPIGPLLAAGAALIVGFAAFGADSPAVGPVAATAAGFGLATLALGPLLLGRDVIRLGLGMALMVTAVELVRAGLAGSPGALEQLATAALTLAVMGATAALAASALAAGHDLGFQAAGQRATLFEAHRLTVPPAGTGDRPGRRPAAAPRAGGAAHQLTLEERLRFEAPPAGDEPADAKPSDAAPSDAEPADAKPSDAEPA